MRYIYGNKKLDIQNTFQEEYKKGDVYANVPITKEKDLVYYMNRWFPSEEIKTQRTREYNKKTKKELKQYQYTGGESREIKSLEEEYEPHPKRFESNDSAVGFGDITL